MMMKFAYKKKQIFVFSLLTLAISSYGHAVAQSPSGSAVSNAAELASVKNQVSQPSKEIPTQYVPLPQTYLSEINKHNEYAVNASSRNQANLKITTTQRSGGLQTFRKVSTSEPNLTSTSAVTANIENQYTARSVQNDTPQAPIIIPQSVSANANTYSASRALGNYQLKNKPYFYQCFHNSAAKYKVPVDLLLAIAQTESSFITNAVGKNSSSEDLGVMQINTSWLPKLGREFGLKRHHLYEPCTNIDIGAWVLAHNFVQFGYTWNAVGAYNAKSPEKRVIYVRKVAKNLEKLRRGEL